MSKQTIVEKILSAPASERPRLLRENMDHLKLADLNLISESLLTNISGTIEKMEGQGGANPEDQKSQDPGTTDIEESENIFDSDDQDADEGVDYLAIATRVAEGSSKKEHKAKKVAEPKPISEAPEEQEDPVEDEKQENIFEEEARTPDPKKPAPLVASRSFSADEDENTGVNADDKKDLLVLDQAVSPSPKATVKEPKKVPRPRATPDKKALVAEKRTKADKLLEAAPLSPANEAQEKEARGSKRVSIADVFGWLTIVMSLAGVAVMLYLCKNLGALGVNLSPFATVGVSTFAGVQVTFSMLIMHTIFTKKFPWIIALVYGLAFNLLAGIEGIREILFPLVP